MMSQDEINSLMAGLDSEVKEDNSPSVGEEFNTTSLDSSSSSDASVDSDDDFDLDALVNEFGQGGDDSVDNTEPKDDNNYFDNDIDIENLDIDTGTEEIANETISNDEIDALINDTSQDNLEENKIEEIEETKEETKEKEPVLEDKTVVTPEQIDAGIFPLPVEKDTKVVNQLSQVAKDGEEKASQIFDVLSYILDENNQMQNLAKEIKELSSKQLELLELLNKKFPNIKQFKESLEQTKEIMSKLEEMSSKVDNENMKLFEAMELMQFQDIHRQKIERVMSVIKKLSNYLNNLFEDESGEIDNLVVAKHIHGDSEEVVDADDLEALINQYNQ